MHKLYSRLQKTSVRIASLKFSLFVSLGLVVALVGPVLAQKEKGKPNRRDSLFCGAPTLPEAERRALESQIRLALQVKKASGQDKAGITYIPIKPHIFRRANGTGGMSLASLNNVLAINNRYYLNNGNGIQFYFCGTAPDYIDNDALFTAFPSGDESSVSGRDATNAMNAYFVNRFDNSGLLGYAYFPSNTIQSTRCFIRTGALSDGYIGDYIVSHELGHNFSLYHTFQNAGTPDAELVTRGAGANCSTNGDELCDTPADPYTNPSRAGFSTATVNGCEVYTGTIVDANGNPYTPQTSNIMSYYEGCNVFFTGSQYDRVQAGLAFRQNQTTAYTLNCGPTAVATPTAVNASRIQSGGIAVQWQDNASNELGYLIERATSASGLFVPVGGVAPNATVFNDLSTVPNTTYWYRVRPSNSTTGGISGVATATAGDAICRPSFVRGCNDDDGLNSFAVNGVTLSANSQCSPTSYDVFTSPAPVVYAGQTVPVGGTFLSSRWEEGVAIWADLNRNNVFESFERLYATPNTLTTSFSGNLTIPPGTAAGALSIRVVVVYEDIPTDPCGGYEYGEAEDYVLTVESAPSCTTMYTTKPGDWNDPSVWSCNRIPTSADPVEVRHAITVATNTTVLAQRVTYADAGRVTFGSGGRLRVGP